MSSEARRFPTNAVMAEPQDWSRASWRFEEMGFDAALGKSASGLRTSTTNPSLASRKRRAARKALRATVEALGRKAGLGALPPVADESAESSEAAAVAADALACLSSVPDEHLLDREQTSGLTLLQAAAALNEPSFIEAFLARAAERTADAIYATDESGATALHLASYHGNGAAVHALLAPLSDDAARGRYTALATHARRETALDAASKRGHADVVKALLSQTPHDRVAHAANNALSYACRHGYADVVILLLNAADAHFKDDAERVSQACNLVHVACESGDVACVEAVRAYGTKAGSTVENIVNNRKRGTAVTLAHSAATAGAPGAPALLRFLSEKGADLGERDGEGETPLLHACRWNRRANVSLIVEILGPESLFDTNLKGESALAVAASEGHSALSEYLADQAPALLTLADRSGRVPRQRASHVGLGYKLADRARKSLNVPSQLVSGGAHPGARSMPPWSVSQHM